MGHSASLIHRYILSNASSLTAVFHLRADGSLGPWQPPCLPVPSLFTAMSETKSQGLWDSEGRGRKVARGWEPSLWERAFDANSTYVEISKQRLVFLFSSQLPLVTKHRPSLVGLLQSYSVAVHFPPTHCCFEGVDARDNPLRGWNKI